MVVERPPEEDRLVARARAGDESALAEIMERYGTIAFRTAWLITRSAADAEEAAQDGFAKAFAALGRFKPGAPLRPWLLTIVANEARNRRGAAARRERLALRAAREPVPSPAGASPEEAVIRDEQRADLLAAIE